MPINEGSPTLHSCTALASDAVIFDVKFWPYPTKNDGDQVFAAVAESVVFVCRPKLGQQPPYDVLRWFQDDQEDASLNCVAWLQHPDTGAPLLCVAGHKPKFIKIYDVEKGKVDRLLSGHGKGINDLAGSPASPELIASGSEDNTIRIWNIQEQYSKQPCVAILGGEGHKAAVLGIRFHPNGQWLLSGGIGAAVCLWAIPSPDQLRRTNFRHDYPKPLIVVSPHFFSKEIHPNYVDCFEFYGDLIFSRAAREHEILLWKIDGFDASEPPPTEPAVVKPGARTHTCFPHDRDKRGFQRVLTFSIPKTERFYLRFSLFSAPSRRPILAMGNESSKFFFWDLQRLEEGVDPRDVAPSKPGKGKKRGNGGVADHAHLSRAGSVLSSARDDTSSASGSVAPRESAPPSTERIFTLDDRFTPLVAHHTQVANTKLSRDRHFATPQVAWSPDGTWLVGGGDHGMLCIFHRDKAVV